MTDYDKLHDTILDMEASLSTNLNGYSMWHYGADIHGITRETLKNAIEALKAQEPRLMTLEEVKRHNNQDGCVWFEQPTYNAVAAFVRKEEFEIEVISPYILGEPINHGYWLSSNYNVTWRCWTSRPDEKRRAETPWERKTD